MLPRKPSKGIYDKRNGYENTSNTFQHSVTSVGHCDRLLGVATWLGLLFRCGARTRLPVRLCPLQGGRVGRQGASVIPTLEAWALEKATKRWAWRAGVNLDEVLFISLTPEVQQSIVGEAEYLQQTEKP